jgi:hypothetical protein
LDSRLKIFGADSGELLHTLDCSPGKLFPSSFGFFPGIFYNEFVLIFIFEQ